LALLAAALMLAAAPLARADDNPNQAKDTKIVQTAWDDWLKTQDRGLRPHIPALREVLDRAPPSYPMIEQRGQTWTVRAQEESEAIMLGILATAATQAKKTEVVVDYNTYGNASLLLGWYFVHLRQPDQALEALNHGLALQPDNGALVGEKGMALALQRRFDDALRLYDDWLALAPGGDTSPHRARILRARGFALVELKQFDEAERAYQDSLKLEPDHAGARRELDYIAAMRQGAAPTAMGIYTGEEAKKERK